MREEKSGSDKVIVALDVSSAARAIELVKMMRGLAGMYKIGSQMYMTSGPRVVREIIDQGERVFLDLKFHDIPNTVARAAVEAGRLGVSALTVHASGGRAMMLSAIKELEAQFGTRRPWVFAVTVLTSLDDSALLETGVGRAVTDQVQLLARLVADCGVDGIVCSPHEVSPLRETLGRRLKIMTPGIRLTGQTTDDQHRTSTPAAAIAAGADYIVVGRSVIDADNPKEALLDILSSL